MLPICNMEIFRVFIGDWTLEIGCKCSFKVDFNLPDLKIIKILEPRIQFNQYDKILILEY